MPHDEDVPQPSLPDLLRRYRGGLTQGDFAARVGVNESSIAAAETGRRSLGIDKIERISDRLNLTDDQHAELRSARDRQSAALSSKPAPAAASLDDIPAALAARLDQIDERLAAVGEAVTESSENVIKLLELFSKLARQRREDAEASVPAAAGE